MVVVETLQGRIIAFVTDDALHDGIADTRYRLARYRCPLTRLFVILPEVWDGLIRANAA